MILLSYIAYQMIFLYTALIDQDEVYKRTRDANKDAFLQVTAKTRDLQFILLNEEEWEKCSSSE